MLRCTQSLPYNRAGRGASKTQRAQGREHRWSSCATLTTREGQVSKRKGIETRKHVSHTPLNKGRLARLQAEGVHCSPQQEDVYACEGDEKPRNPLRRQNTAPGAEGEELYDGTVDHPWID